MACFRNEIIRSHSIKQVNICGGDLQFLFSQYTQMGLGVNPSVSSWPAFCSNIGVGNGVAPKRGRSICMVAGGRVASSICIMLCRRVKQVMGGVLLGPYSIRNAFTSRRNLHWWSKRNSCPNCNTVSGEVDTRRSRRSKDGGGDFVYDGKRGDDGREEWYTV